MSNLIKSYCANVDSLDKCIVDSSAFEVSSQKRIIGEPGVGIADNKENHLMDVNKSLKEREMAVLMQEEEMKEKCNSILQTATETAKQIIEDANDESDKIRNDARYEGIDMGYTEGLQKAEEEVEALKQRLLDEHQEREKEFEEKTASFEVEFVELAANLIEKITGIIVEGNKEVIHHIIERALTNVEKSDTYYLRVSKEDYNMIFAKKQELQACLKEGAVLEIVESDKLEHNKCLIETDNSVIDCSLDAQLSNLSTDLKLLSRT